MIEIEIVPFIPIGKRGFPPKAPLADIVNAILYKLKTRVQWHQLPIRALFHEEQLSWQSVASVENTVDNINYYYQKFSSYLLERKQRVSSIKKRTEGIVLSVENIVFDKKELYFVIRIDNKSS